MIKKKMIPALLLLLLLLVSGCRESGSDDELNGRVTIWHSWTPEEQVVLDEALVQFQEIHPGVSIVLSDRPEDTILADFLTLGSEGLAPDLLIGSDDWIDELVDGGFVRPISVDLEQSELFNARNRALSEYNKQLYGVPLSLEPRALYYNKNLVTDPLGTLDELLQEADAGNEVAFVPRFQEAYWGIQTFGAGIFDDQNHFTLAESGFAEWLDWLAEAQRSPGVLLNVDDESLLNLFISGQIAYYVAGPERQVEILANIDEENPLEFGVVPLPEGPNGLAGPLLPAESILLYTFSSAKQSQIANALAAFLVNRQQGIRFMRELQRVPANPEIRVDGRIYPIANGFAQQARTAVVIPNKIPTEAFYAAGDRAFVSVLSGALSAEEAVCQFGQDVAALQVFMDSEMSLPDGCETISE